MKAAPTIQQQEKQAPRFLNRGKGPRTHPPGEQKLKAAPWRRPPAQARRALGEPRRSGAGGTRDGPAVPPRGICVSPSEIRAPGPNTQPHSWELSSGRQDTRRTQHGSPHSSSPKTEHGPARVCVPPKFTRKPSPAPGRWCREVGLRGCLGHERVPSARQATSPDTRPAGALPLDAQSPGREK